MGLQEFGSIHLQLSCRLSGHSERAFSGHIVGPFKEPPFPNLHCSPLGAVPKKDGSYRLIIDLSSPPGKAVNDFISKDDFSVTFSSFDDAV